MRVALVHDYLREYGGAERVLEDLREIFPEAPVFTSYYDPRGLGIHNERIQKWDIRKSWMQKIPFAGRFLSALRVLAPMAFESFDLSDFDVVISSCNHHSAKAVLTKPGTLHISYIHTPPKMLYGYTTSYNYKKHWWTKVAGELANHFLRVYDYEISQRPDILVANSKNVSERIKKFYRRDSVVVYPGVDISAYRKVQKRDGKFFFALSRLTRGKGVEIIVSACTTLKLPLKVAGSGPELERLRKIAGDTVEFLGAVTDEEKLKLYSEAKALIVCTEQEDFGMTPPEAMAAGVPVIAARSGGYLETVIEGKTGEFFEVPPDLGYSQKYVDHIAVDNLVKVLQAFDSKKYKEADCRKRAEEFSKEKFQKGMKDLVSKNIKTV